MAHDEDGARVGEDRVLEEVERLGVEVVRRLVEHEHVARTREEAGEEEAGALAAREVLHRLTDAIGLEEEVGEIRHHVTALPLELDDVRAVRHALHDRLVGVEGGVQGVEPDRGEVRAAADGAGERRQLAQQRPQERRLPAAVRPHEADAVAAHDEEVETSDDRRRAVTGRQALRLEDEPPGAVGFGDRELDRARRVAAVAPLLAQTFELLDAGLVAVALGLQALATPDLLLREELVGLLAPVGLVLGALLLAAQVVVVVAGPGGELAAVDLEDAGREPAKERPVVRDEERRAAALEQMRLEPLDAREVEVVRRLVEEQHVGRRGERAGEEHAPGEARGKGRDVRVGGELESLEEALEALPRAPGLLAAAEAA